MTDYTGDLITMGSLNSYSPKTDYTGSNGYNEMVNFQCTNGKQTLTTETLSFGQTSVCKGSLAKAEFNVPAL